MSENLNDDFTPEFTRELIERYRKAIREMNENFVKQKVLIQMLWTKIAELIEKPEDLAEFINKVYD